MGGGGWCVICSELSTKSTPVIDTRVLGRHGMMMSGSSGAFWVSEVRQNLPNCRFTCQRGPLGCMAQKKRGKKGKGGQLKFDAIFKIYVIHRFEVQQKLVIFCCYMGLLWIYPCTRYKRSWMMGGLVGLLVLEVFESSLESPKM